MDQAFFKRCVSVYDNLLQKDITAANVPLKTMQFLDAFSFQHFNVSAVVKGDNMAHSVDLLLAAWKWARSQIHADAVAFIKHAEQYTFDPIELHRHVRKDPAHGDLIKHAYWIYHAYVDLFNTMTELRAERTMYVNLLH